MPPPILISSKANPIIKECIKIRTKYSKNFKKCFTFNSALNFKGDDDAADGTTIVQYKSLPILMNGLKIIKESSEKYGIEPKWLFHTASHSEIASKIQFGTNNHRCRLRNQREDDGASASSVQYYQVNENLINHLCGDIVSNDGYCAVYDNYNPFKLFQERNNSNSDNSITTSGGGGGGVYVYCYKLSDPNNLGSIIRMSFGFDIKAIFLSEDCVSPFTERSIRSSRNYILNIPVFHLPLKDYKSVIHDQLKCKTTLIADASSEHSIPIQNYLQASKKNKQQEGSDDVCLIMGNEHHGFCDSDFNNILLPQLESSSTIGNHHRNSHEYIYIPMKNNLDSFSVSHAASILMYELTRK